MLLPDLGIVVTLTWQQHRGLRRLSGHLVKDYNSMITKIDSIPHSGRGGVAGATKVPLFERKIEQTQMWSCLYKRDIHSTTVSFGTGSSTLQKRQNDSKEVTPQRMS